MSWPISKSQVRKLGDRLRETSDPPYEDRVLLASVLASHEAALTEAEERLADLRLPATTRLKNSGTILEKLRRDPRMKLDAIQDLAGARIVLARGLGYDEQDRVRDLLVEAFGDVQGPPRVADRRAVPSHGYRAVHVVARVRGVRVELQVRTALQHQWAQHYEKLADQLGRGIRYGARPERLDALLADERHASLRGGMEELWTGLVGLAHETADQIDALEGIRSDELAETRQRIERSVEKQLDLTERVVRELMSRIREVLAS